MFDLGVFVALVVVGSVAGCIAEARHYASIRKWEAELAHEPPGETAPEAAVVQRYPDPLTPVSPLRANSRRAWP